MVGELTSAGNNIERGITCGLVTTGDHQDIDPRLGALSATGAPNGVPTYPLSGNSPAIDDAGTTCGLSEDARGLTRPIGGGCDIGAREETQADLGVTISDAPDPVIAGEVLTYTVTVTNNGPGAATDGAS